MPASAVLRRHALLIELRSNRMAALARPREIEDPPDHGQFLRDRDHVVPLAVGLEAEGRVGAVVYITGDALDEQGEFPSSNHTTRDDGFTTFPADSVINDAGDVHIYVARDGRSYRVVTAAGSAEYSTVEADNPHTFAYPEEEYPEAGAPGVAAGGLPRCKG